MDAGKVGIARGHVGNSLLVQSQRPAKYAENLVRYHWITITRPIDSEDGSASDLQKKMLADCNPSSNI
jgi:hypothetical protein